MNASAALAADIFHRKSHVRYRDAAISPVWDAIKGSIFFCCTRADYFDDLANNLNHAKHDIGRLEKWKENVLQRVRKETKPQMEQKYEVTDWLDRVNHLQKDAKEMIKEADEEIRNKALRWFCPKKCCSYNRVGKRVSEKRREVNQLIEAGKFDAVVERKSGDFVIQMPVPKTFGLESKLEEIWRWIEDPSVEIIGLYGMGGVGKTTLLRKIYNKICEKSDYVVIFVERSEQDPVKAAKEAICKKIEISQEDWINKEGFLDQSDSTYEAREEGEDALGSLKSASLLESGKSEDFVKMHDVIQAMTLWLAREEGKAEDKVLVLEKTPQLSKWINAERISLWGASIESLPEHLLAIILQHNEGLIELPVGIGNLRNLRYLNLSGTCIEILQMESFIIAAFRRVFDQILLLNSPLDDEVELLKELESLEHIDEIGIFLSYASFVQKVLDSDTDKLRRRIKQLQLVQGTDHPRKLSLRGMEHLERLELLKCSSLTEVEIVKENNQQEPQGSEINVSPDHRWRKMQESFPNLCIVRICDCPIKNVTCLINVPSLQSLKLSGCNEIIEVAELVKSYKVYNPHTTPYYYRYNIEEDPNACVIQ
ncbi:hypothetical protein GH714_024129 [Hevea brasiliensis]|uniref:NB-ARC domain-containing protein n=1 Tax=Hevea brasiliensis TaxID=3981 RepID=A0A6A6LJ44_HEVBR|nr:hypothetical protein GH714_024129 [Hevea brasiliensis]